MGVLASALKIGACLLFAFGRSLMLFYIATFPDSFYVIAGVAVRSSITKLVKEEEQGRMNAFTGGIEALVFCLSSSFYAYIYARTLVDFPGAIYLISVALAAMGVIAFWYIGNRITWEGGWFMLFNCIAGTKCVRRIRNLSNKWVS